MAYFETPELPQTRALPQVMVGAASPLWAYFAVAAAGGVAFWWMTRWTRPVNLEAMFETAAPALQVAEAIAEVPAAIAEATAELAVEAAPPLPPVTEASPALAAASDAPVVEVPEPIVEAAVEAAAEPSTWVDPEAPADLDEPVTDPAPKARKAKLAAAPEATPEA